MNLFNAKLSSAQRALLQSIITILIGSVIAGLSVATSYLSGTGMIDYTRLLTIIGLTVAFAFAHGIITLLMSSNADLALALDAFVSVAEKRIGLSSSQSSMPAPTVNTAPAPTVTIVHNYATGMSTPTTGITATSALAPAGMLNPQMLAVVKPPALPASPPTPMEHPPTSVVTPSVSVVPTAATPPNTRTMLAAQDTVPRAIVGK